MPIVMFLELPGVTTEQYDSLNEAMGTTRPEDEPDALLFHVCATAADGLLICDIWQSQAELDDFVANRLGPAAAQLRLPPAPPPRLADLHYQVGPREPTG
jgi:hypothetical protein